MYLKHVYYVLYSTCVKCTRNYCIKMNAFEIVNYIYVLYHFICNIIGLLKCKFNSCSLCVWKGFHSIKQMIYLIFNIQNLVTQLNIMRINYIRILLSSSDIICILHTHGK